MPDSEMLPTVAPVWKRCLETHEALLECLAEFPEDRFNWRPTATTRSPAEIIAHVARGECVYAMCVKPRSRNRPAIAYPGTKEAADPGALVPSDRVSALHIVTLAFNFAERVVSRATEADLERIAAVNWRPLGPEVKGPLTGLWFVEQMNRHKAYHLGQLWYVISMFE